MAVNSSYRPVIPTTMSNKTSTTEMFDNPLAAIEQAKQSCKYMLQKIETEIQDRANKNTCLQRLITAISQEKDCFDSDDSVMVQKCYADNQAKLQELQKTYATKKIYFEQTLADMHRKLDVRKKILEEMDTNTNVLQSHPELFQFFVQKQAQLTQMYQDTYTQMGVSTTSTGSMPAAAANATNSTAPPSVGL